MSVTTKPNHRKKKKQHGFLARSRSASGRKVLRRRRAKGRKRLAV